ncbi:amidase family protein [Nocardia sp. CA-084685]|uniref:amidase family protein n=1 Tax=Nocardia sp. CA-084685 TaxID=3239970 RepID=UPI003D98E1B0
MIEKTEASGYELPQSAGKTVWFKLFEAAGDDDPSQAMPDPDVDLNFTPGTVKRGASQARREVRNLLRQAGLPDERVDAVESVVSDAMQNVARHVPDSDARVRVWRTGRVEIGDNSQNLPRPQEDSGTDAFSDEEADEWALGALLPGTHGRFFREMVGQLANTWGVNLERAGGKTIWFDFGTTGPADVDENHSTSPPEPGVPTGAVLAAQPVTSSEAQPSPSEPARSPEEHATAPHGRRGHQSGGPNPEPDGTAANPSGASSAEESTEPTVPPAIQELLDQLDNTGDAADTQALVIEQYKGYLRARERSIYQEFLNNRKTDLANKGTSAQAAESLAEQQADEFIQTDRARQRITQDAIRNTLQWVQNAKIPLLPDDATASPSNRDTAHPDTEPTVETSAPLPQTLRTILAEIDSAGADPVATEQAKNLVRERYEEHLRVRQASAHRRYMEQRTAALLGKGVPAADAERRARQDADVFIRSRKAQRAVDSVTVNNAKQWVDKVQKSAERANSNFVDWLARLYREAHGIPSEPVAGLTSAQRAVLDLMDSVRDQLTAAETRLAALLKQHRDLQANGAHHWQTAFKAHRSALTELSLHYSEGKAADGQPVTSQTDTSDVSGHGTSVRGLLGEIQLAEQFDQIDAVCLRAEVAMPMGPRIDAEIDVVTDGNRVWREAKTNTIDGQASKKAEFEAQARRQLHITHINRAYWVDGAPPQIKWHFMNGVRPSMKARLEAIRIEDEAGRTIPDHRIEVIDDSAEWRTESSVEATDEVPPPAEPEQPIEVRSGTADEPPGPAVPGAERGQPFDGWISVPDYSVDDYPEYIEPVFSGYNHDHDRVMEFTINQVHIVPLRSRDRRILGPLFPSRPHDIEVFTAWARRARESAYYEYFPIWPTWDVETQTENHGHEGLDPIPEPVGWYDPDDPSEPILTVAHGSFLDYSIEVWNPEVERYEPVTVVGQTFGQLLEASEIFQTAYRQSHPGSPLLVMSCLTALDSHGSPHANLARYLHEQAGIEADVWSPIGSPHLRTDGSVRIWIEFAEDGAMVPPYRVARAPLCPPPESGGKVSSPDDTIGDSLVTSTDDTIDESDDAEIPLYGSLRDRYIEFSSDQVNIAPIYSHDGRVTGIALTSQLGDIEKIRAWGRNAHRSAHREFWPVFPAPDGATRVPDVAPEWRRGAHPEPAEWYVRGSTPEPILIAVRGRETTYTVDVRNPETGQYEAVDIDGIVLGRLVEASDHFHTAYREHQGSPLLQVPLDEGGLHPDAHQLLANYLHRRGFEADVWAARNRMDLDADSGTLDVRTEVAEDGTTVSPFMVTRAPRAMPTPWSRKNGGNRDPHERIPDVDQPGAVDRPVDRGGRKVSTHHPAAHQADLDKAPKVDEALDFPRHRREAEPRVANPGRGVPVQAFVFARDPDGQNWGDVSPDVGRHDSADSMETPPDVTPPQTTASSTPTGPVESRFRDAADKIDRSGWSLDAREAGKRLVRLLFDLTKVEQEKVQPTEDDFGPLLTVDVSQRASLKADSVPGNPLNAFSLVVREFVYRQDVLRSWIDDMFGRGSAGDYQMVVGAVLEELAAQLDATGAGWLQITMSQDSTGDCELSAEFGRHGVGATAKLELELEVPEGGGLADAKLTLTTWVDSEQDPDSVIAGVSRVVRELAAGWLTDRSDVARDATERLVRAEAAGRDGPAAAFGLRITAQWKPTARRERSGQLNLVICDVRGRPTPRGGIVFDDMAVTIADDDTVDTVVAEVCRRTRADMAWYWTNSHQLDAAEAEVAWHVRRAMAGIRLDRVRRFDPRVTEDPNTKIRTVTVRSERSGDSQAAVGLDLHWYTEAESVDVGGTFGATDQHAYAEWVVYASADEDPVVVLRRTDEPVLQALGDRPSVKVRAQKLVGALIDMELVEPGRPGIVRVAVIGDEVRVVVAHGDPATSVAGRRVQDLLGPGGATRVAVMSWSNGGTIIVAAFNLPPSANVQGDHGGSARRPRQSTRLDPRGTATRINTVLGEQPVPDSSAPTGALDLRNVDAVRASIDALLSQHPSTGQGTAARDSGQATGEPEVRRTAETALAPPVLANPPVHPAGDDAEPVRRPERVPSLPAMGGGAVPPPDTRLNDRPLDDWKSVKHQMREQFRELDLVRRDGGGAARAPGPGPAPGHPERAAPERLEQHTDDTADRSLDTADRNPTLGTTAEAADPPGPQAGLGFGQKPWLGFHHPEDPLHRESGEGPTPGRPPQPARAADNAPGVAQLRAAVDTEMLELVRDAVAAEHTAADPRKTDAPTDSTRGRRLNGMRTWLNRLRTVINQRDTEVTPEELRELWLLVHLLHAAIEWLAFGGANDATVTARVRQAYVGDQDVVAEDAVNRCRAADDRIRALTYALDTNPPSGTPDPGAAAPPGTVPEPEQAVRHDPGPRSTPGLDPAAKHSRPVRPQTDIPRERLDAYVQLGELRPGTPEHERLAAEIARLDALAHDQLRLDLAVISLEHQLTAPDLTSAAVAELTHRLDQLRPELEQANHALAPGHTGTAALRGTPPHARAHTAVQPDEARLALQVVNDLYGRHVVTVPTGVRDGLGYIDNSKRDIAQAVGEDNLHRLIAWTEAFDLVDQMPNGATALVRILWRAHNDTVLVLTKDSGGPVISISPTVAQRLPVERSTDTKQMDPFIRKVWVALFDENGALIPPPKSNPGGGVPPSTGPNAPGPHPQQSPAPGVAPAPPADAVGPALPDGLNHDASNPPARWTPTPSSNHQLTTSPAQKSAVNQPLRTPWSRQSASTRPTQGTPPASSTTARAGADSGLEKQQPRGAADQSIEPANGGLPPGVFTRPPATTTSRSTAKSGGGAPTPDDVIDTIDAALDQPARTDLDSLQVDDPVATDREKPVASEPASTPHTPSTPQPRSDSLSPDTGPRRVPMGYIGSQADALDITRERLERNEGAEVRVGTAREKFLGGEYLGYMTSRDGVPRVGASASGPSANKPQRPGGTNPAADRTADSETHHEPAQQTTSITADQHTQPEPDGADREGWAVERSEQVEATEDSAMPSVGGDREWGRPSGTKEDLDRAGADLAELLGIDRGSLQSSHLLRSALDAIWRRLHGRDDAALNHVASEEKLSKLKDWIASWMANQAVIDAPGITVARELASLRRRAGLLAQLPEILGLPKSSAGVPSREDPSAELRRLSAQATEASDFADLVAAIERFLHLECRVGWDASRYTTSADVGAAFSENTRMFVLGFESLDLVQAREFAETVHELHDLFPIHLQGIDAVLDDKDGVRAVAEPIILDNGAVGVYRITLMIGRTAGSTIPPGDIRTAVARGFGDAMMIAGRWRAGKHAIGELEKLHQRTHKDKSLDGFNTWLHEQFDDFMFFGGDLLLLKEALRVSFARVYQGEPEATTGQKVLYQLLIDQAKEWKDRSDLAFRDPSTPAETEQLQKKITKINELKSKLGIEAHGLVMVDVDAETVEEIIDEVLFNHEHIGLDNVGLAEIRIRPEGSESRYGSTWLTLNGARLDVSEKWTISRYMKYVSNLKDIIDGWTVGSRDEAMPNTIGHEMGHVVQGFPAGHSQMEWDEKKSKDWLAVFLEIIELFEHDNPTRGQDWALDQFKPWLEREIGKYIYDADGNLDLAEIFAEGYNAVRWFGDHAKEVPKILRNHLVKEAHREAGRRRGRTSSPTHAPAAPPPQPEADPSLPAGPIPHRKPLAGAPPTPDQITDVLGGIDKRRVRGLDLDLAIAADPGGWHPERLNVFGKGDAAHPKKPKATSGTPEPASRPVGEPNYPVPQGDTGRRDDKPEPTPDSLEISAAANDSRIEPNGSELSRETEPSDDSKEAKTTESVLSVIRAKRAFGIRLATEELHTGGMVLAETAMGLYLAAEAGPVALGASTLIIRVLPVVGAPIVGYMADNSSRRKGMWKALGIGSAGAGLAILAVAANNSYTVPGLVGATVLEVVSNQLYRAMMFRYLEDEAGDAAQQSLERFHNVVGGAVTNSAQFLGPVTLALGSAVPSVINLGTNIVSMVSLPLVPDTTTAPKTSESESTWKRFNKSIREGVHTIQDNPLLRRINTNGGLTWLFLGAQTTQLTWLIAESGLSYGQMGVAAAIPLVGLNLSNGILINQLAGERAQAVRISRLLTAKLIAAGGVAGAMATTSDPWVTSLLLAGAWMVFSPSNVAINIHVTATVPKQLRGRVRSLRGMTQGATAGLSSLGAAGAIEAWGPEPTAIGMAAVFGSIAFVSVIRRIFGEDKALQDPTVAARARKLLDGINQTAEVVRALGLNEPKPKPWQKKWPHVRDAIATQLVKIHLDPDNLLGEVRKSVETDSEIDTAVVFFIVGDRILRFVVTDTGTDGQSIVFDTTITNPDPGNPRVRISSEWQQPDISNIEDAEAFVWYCTRTDGNLTSRQPQQPNQPTPRKKGTPRNPPTDTNSDRNPGKPRWKWPFGRQQADPASAGQHIEVHVTEDGATSENRGETPRSGVRPLAQRTDSAIAVDRTAKTTAPEQHAPAISKRTVIEMAEISTDRQTVHRDAADFGEPPSARDPGSPSAATAPDSYQPSTRGPGAMPVDSAGAIDTERGAVDGVDPGRGEPNGPAPQGDVGRWLDPAIIDLERADGRAAQQAMADGRITSVELVQGRLWRIQAVDKEGPRLNAIRCLNPAAVEDARLLDEERQRGHVRGPFHGLTVVVKDVYNVAGMPTTAGALALAYSFPVDDAFVIRRLRLAGAVILGKSNMSELSNYIANDPPSGDSALGGPVSNAYGSHLDPRGSSTGSAVVVAAGEADAALSVETGGSTIAPSIANSIVGVDLTVGLASRNGIMTLSDVRDSPGVMARTVYDASALVTVIAGIDPEDPATEASAGVVGTDYTAGLSIDGLRGKRIGVVHLIGVDDETMNDYLMGASTGNVSAAFANAQAVLIAQGATLVEATIDSTNIKWAPDTMPYEVKKSLNRYFDQLPANAPVKSQDDLVRFNIAHAEDGAIKHGQELLIKSNNVNLDDPVVREENERNCATDNATARGVIDSALAANQLDALLFIQIASCIVAPRSGYPQVAVPIGYDPDNNQPFGMVLVGTAFSEATLLACAHAYLEAAQVRRPPSEISPSFYTTPPHTDSGDGDPATRTQEKPSTRTRPDHVVPPPPTVSPAADLTSSGDRTESSPTHTGADTALPASHTPPAAGETDSAARNSEATAVFDAKPTVVGGGPSDGGVSPPSSTEAKRPGIQRNTPLGQFDVVRSEPTDPATRQPAPTPWHKAEAAGAIPASAHDATSASPTTEREEATTTTTAADASSAPEQPKAPGQGNGRPPFEISEEEAQRLCDQVRDREPDIEGGTTSEIYLVHTSSGLAVMRLGKEPPKVNFLKKWMPENTARERARAGGVRAPKTLYNGIDGSTGREFTIMQYIPG